MCASRPRGSASQGEDRAQKPMAESREAVILRRKVEFNSIRS